ncbi:MULTISPECIES: arabinose transporter [Bradyrhizobium]|jgi:MFS family permease|uniref:arabinose transporter n=1 Tax=Bradyrhizobium TaxID=374 RepID=UPI000402DB4C|nr:MULTISPECIES: arabinose transporter [Bradyrhizobium]MBK5651571.1 arabinose transporter [Rhizobium sp.]OCX26017.1 arabinose transporter [Bradyrhizobium sp. UASWS1016]
MKQNDPSRGKVSRPDDDARSAAALLPIMAVVFIAYLVIGLAMPVLPIYVHLDLGLSTFVVGLVSGSQFVASFFSRVWAGHHADTRGHRHAVVTGLLIAATSGLLYLASLPFVAHHPVISIGIVMLGRAVLGVAESLIVTGALSWGLALMGPRNTGAVMSWVGTSLYAAFAVGAPAGTALYAACGFAAIALAATLIPLAVLPLVASVSVAPVMPHAPAGLIKVARAVWLPGLGVALSGVGFGAIITFIGLLFAQRGWAPAWPAFTVLSVAFIAGRALFGHLPDRIGGAKVALACILIEAVGQALIWLAPSSAVALLGVTVSGFGYSLVYPGLGVEAIRRAPPQSRGLAMGAYTVCLDLSLGLASPALGLVAGRGLGSVYLASTLIVLGSGLIALHLLNAAAPRQDDAPIECSRQEIPREASNRGHRSALADVGGINGRKGDRHDRIKADAEL